MVRSSHYLQSNSSVFLPFAARFVEAAAFINTGKHDKELTGAKRKHCLIVSHLIFSCTVN